MISPAHIHLGLVVRCVDTTYRSTGENFDLFPQPPMPDAAQTDQMGASGLHPRRSAISRCSAAVCGTRSRARLRQLPDHHPEPRRRLRPAGADHRQRRSAEIRLAGDDRVRSHATRSVLGARRDDGSADRQSGRARSRSGPAASPNCWPSPAPGPQRRRQRPLRLRRPLGGTATWRIAPAYRVAATGTLLKASVGTGFKSPTLSELFVSFPEFDFFANPDLKPETSFGYDAGFEQPLWQGRVASGRHLVPQRYPRPDRDGAAPARPFESPTPTSAGPRPTAWRASPRCRLTDPGSTCAPTTPGLIARDDIAREEFVRRPKTKASVTADWRRANGSGWRPAWSMSGPGSTATATSDPAPDGQPVCDGQCRRRL